MPYACRKCSAGYRRNRHTTPSYLDEPRVYSSDGKLGYLQSTASCIKPYAPHKFSKYQI